MPRPPRKPRNMGQLWPARAASAAVTSAALVPRVSRARITAATPLPMSRVSTMAAALPPPVRRTLDIPVRPLP